MSYFGDREDSLVYGSQGKIKSGQPAGENEMARRLAETRLVTGTVRLSYAHLFEPYAGTEGQEKKYSVSLLIPKRDTATVKMINEAVEKAVQMGVSSKWGGKRPKNLKLPMRDGDEEKDDDIYKGNYFINANNKRKPGVIDKFKNKIDDPDEVYSGCYALASITFYAYNANGNIGVGCSIDNVMKVEDGDPLGNSHSAESDFDDVDSDDGLD